MGPVCLDGVEAELLVQRHGLRLPHARLQEERADLLGAGAVLEDGQQPGGDASAAVPGVDEHPLDLPDSRFEGQERDAARRLAVDVGDEEPGARVEPVGGGILGVPGVQLVHRRHEQAGQSRVLRRGRDDAHGVHGRSAGRGPVPAGRDRSARDRPTGREGNH